MKKIILCLLTFYSFCAGETLRFVNAGDTKDGNSSTAKAIDEATRSLNLTFDSQPSNNDYWSRPINVGTDYNPPVARFLTSGYSQWYALTKTQYNGHSSPCNQELSARRASGAPIQITITPEPATLVLAGSVLVMLGMLRRLPRPGRDR